MELAFGLENNYDELESMEKPTENMEPWKKRYSTFNKNKEKSYALLRNVTVKI